MSIPKNAKHWQRAPERRMPITKDECKVLIEMFGRKDDIGVKAMFRDDGRQRFRLDVKRFLGKLYTVALRNGWSPPPKGTVVADTRPIPPGYRTRIHD
jgi:hypothetical protein